LTLFVGLQESIKTLNPADLLEYLLKKINYKDYLLKEEGSEQVAEEKYDNL
jgi:hypothetical protein